MNADQALDHIDEHFTSYGNPHDPIDAESLRVLRSVVRAATSTARSDYPSPFALAGLRRTLAGDAR